MNQIEKVLEIRKQIDRVDDAINELLCERMEYIHAMKTAKNGVIAVFQPKREAQIIRRVIATNKSDLPSEEVAKIFKQIITSFRTREERIGTK